MCGWGRGEQRLRCLTATACVLLNQSRGCRQEGAAAARRARLHAHALHCSAAQRRPFVRGEGLQVGAEGVFGCVALRCDG